LFLYKIREQEGGTAPFWRGWYQLGEGGGERVYENGKMRPVETIPGMGWGGERGTKENGGGSEFNYDIFDTL
jgi:hypothetical protein